MKASIQNRLFENKSFILNKYNETKSCRIVAEELGVSMVAIWKFIKQNSDLCKRRRLDENQEKELAKDYIAGMSAEKVGKKYGVSYTVARDYLIRTGTELKTSKDYRKHSIDKTFFKKELDEKVLWFLGWMYSDGNVCKKLKRFNIVVHKKDREVLEKLEKLLGSKDLIVNPKNKNVSTLYGNSTDMCSDLIKLGCVPAKSLIIKYPNFLQSNEQNWQFLRGVFEGDGHISLKNENRCANAEIASGSLDFLKSIQNLLKDKLNLDTKIYERANSNSKRIVILGGIKEIERFMDALYANASPACRMDRKYAIYLQLKEACKNLN